jgi:hypothetical protein
MKVIIRDPLFHAVSGENMSGIRVSSPSLIMSIVLISLEMMPEEAFRT